MTQKTIPQTGASNTSKPQAGTSTGLDGGSSPDRAENDLKEGLAGGAREITAEVKHVASDVAADAKRAAESKLGAGKDLAAEHLGSLADALRRTGKELRSNESPATDYVERAASSVEKISDYFQTRTLGQLLGDVETYARREPAVFLGGAFFAGLLGGRFLKSATPGHSRGNTSSANGRLQPSAYAGHRALPPHSRTGTSTAPTSPAHGAPNATATSVPSDGQLSPNSQAGNDAWRGPGRSGVR
ncbi:hypothetical protein [Pendulispora albinea]|uniref:Uncharacterized protein n=1 Tax=Pendulispora albinea TaxID=2741071 RepID=A0ABZ2LWL9_9BACT